MMRTPVQPERGSGGSGRAEGSGIGWVLGWPARAALLAAIGAYRAIVAPFLGSRCRFHPSCSAYAEEAVRVHGALKGLLLAVWRVLRCSPLTLGGPDHVPPRGRWRPDRAEYDADIQLEEAE